MPSDGFGDSVFKSKDQLPELDNLGNLSEFDLGGELWRSVGRACGWKLPRAPAIGMLSNEERETPAALIYPG